MKIPDTFILSAIDYHDFSPFIKFLKQTTDNVFYKEIDDEELADNAIRKYHMIFTDSQEKLDGSYDNIQVIKI